MDMRKYIADEAALAVIYAEDGAYASAARVLKGLAERTQEHADRVSAEMTRMDRATAYLPRPPVMEV